MVSSEDISTLDVMNNLGALYLVLSKNRKAQKLYTQAFKGYQKVLGHYHSKAQQAKFGIMVSIYRSPHKSHRILKALYGKNRIIAW